VAAKGELVVEEKEDSGSQGVAKADFLEDVAQSGEEEKEDSGSQVVAKGELLEEEEKGELVVAPSGEEFGEKEEAVEPGVEMPSFRYHGNGPAQTHWSPIWKYLWRYPFLSQLTRFR